MSIKKGGAKIEEEKKAGDERVFNRLDPNYIGNSWWQHNRADALRIHTYEEVDVSWLQTIASNAFDGSQRLKNFNIEDERFSSLNDSNFGPAK